MENKIYLGDGVYVENDGYNVILTVHDGICEAQKIYLEPEVLACFMSYASCFRERLENGQSS